MSESMESLSVNITPTLQQFYPASTVLCCPECGGEMILRKSPKYPKPFYGCLHYPLCRATHGAHPDGRPLGKPADSVTKRWRIAAHAALDPLWGRDEEGIHCQIQKRHRRAVYAWLAEQLGIRNVGEECHIAMFDSEQCQRVIDVCKNVTRQHILNWQAARMPQPQKKRHRRPPRYAHY